jgi:methylmalonyl-CoA mutase, N-terminal domain
VRKLVGINAYTEGGDSDPDILRIDPAFEVDQVHRVRAVRERRDTERATRVLDALVQVARDPARNLMPLLLDAARADCTEGEIVGALQTVFGSYRESPVF